MGEGQQGQKNVEVRRRSVGVSAEPATGPGQRNQHPYEPIERDQPGGLDGKRKLRGQNGKRDEDRASRCMAGESRSRSEAKGLFVNG